MSEPEPSRRRILVEVLLYTLLVLVVGGAFVLVRVLREGPEVLDHDAGRSRR